MRGMGCGLGWHYPGGGGWGYLGQDDGTDTSSTDTTSVDLSQYLPVTQQDINTTDIAALSAPGGALAAGGVLDPSASDQVSVGALQTYVATGQASDPSTAAQLAQIVAAAGPAVTSVLQQVQFGQLAANTPISQLAALKAAITGSSGVSTVLSTLSSSPLLLIGLIALVFAFSGGRRD